MNRIEKNHIEKIISTRCVICREFLGEMTDGECHHIASGSEKRSHFMTVCLCPHHHRIGSGSLHGGGVKKFIMAYNLGSEYSLLGLQNKFLAQDALL